MVASKFITILQKKEHIQQVETTELKAIVEKYPYFQAARSLYLKGLKNNDSFKYNTELKITASHTTDRTILFNYITSTNFNTQKKIFTNKYLINYQKQLMQKPLLKHLKTLQKKILE